MNLKTRGAPTTIPTTVNKFTRLFHCDTGDRMNPTSRAYLFLKVHGTNGVSNEIMSDRFTIKDNRWTADAASAFYTVQCRFVSDTIDEQLQVRPESIAHSNALPAGNVTVEDF